MKIQLYPHALNVYSMLRSGVRAALSPVHPAHPHPRGLSLIDDNARKARTL